MPKINQEDHHRKSSGEKIIYVQPGSPRYSASMTVKAKAQSTGIGEDLFFNPKYFCTTPGVIKIIELVYFFGLSSTEFNFVLVLFLQTSQSSYSPSSL